MKKKKKKKQAKRDWISKQSRERFFDSSSDLHSSLLHSLGVQLGKARKLHSGEDLNICNYGGEGGVPLWNKPSVFTGGYIFLALGRPTSGLPGDQGSLSLWNWKVICLPLRCAEEETRTFPRVAGNQTDCEPDLAGSLHQDTHQDRNCSVILQTGRS